MKDYPQHIKSFNDICDEYEFVNRLLDLKTSYYNNLIEKGFNIPSTGKHYKYNTLFEAENLSNNIKLEIDRKFILELTASFEAKIVYYFRNIIKRKSKFQKTYINYVPSSVRHGISHLMYHHILVVFKKEIQPIDNIIYSEFKSLIDFRNWLAHGRSWDLDTHLYKFDFQYSLEVIRSIITMIPNYPEELKN